VNRRPLLAAAILAGCSLCARGDDAPLKVSYQLDWYPAPEHGGHYQALVKNYYRDAGLDVTILPGGPGALAVLKVATGRVDIAMGRCDDIILAAKQGLPVVIVGAQMEHDPQAILLHDESPVRSLKDLAGHTVMCRIGDGWISFIEQRYGISFKQIPLDYGFGRFMADKDFIQQCFISNEPYMVEKQGVRTRALLICDGGYDPYRVIFTSQAFARRHPDAVRGFVAATIRGYQEFLHGDAAAARALIQKENPEMTQDVMDYSIGAMKKYRLVEGDPSKGERIGLITPERMKAMVQVMIGLKALDSPLDLDSFVSFAYLPPGFPGKVAPSQP